MKKGFIYETIFYNIPGGEPEFDILSEDKLRETITSLMDAPNVTVENGDDTMNNIPGVKIYVQGEIVFHFYIVSVNFMEITNSCGHKNEYWFYDSVNPDQIMKNAEMLEELQSMICDECLMKAIHQDSQEWD